MGEDERMTNASETNTTATEAAPSYHDLHITTAEIPRTSIFNLPYGYEVSCNRVGGWCLWRVGHEKVLAGEYDSGLRLDVAGHVIVDSLTGSGTQ
jgi:hypothetical protein